MEITPVHLVWNTMPLYHKKPMAGKGNGGLTAFFSRQNDIRKTVIEGRFCSPVQGFPGREKVPCIKGFLGLQFE
ncbi:MAG: hypothetical protein IKB65_01055 [Ruminiclostridium sp.]|nr:hypothetical protein [Ruminiclostridium sp.]